VSVVKVNYGQIAYTIFASNAAYESHINCTYAQCCDTVYIYHKNFYSSVLMKTIRTVNLFMSTMEKQGEPHFVSPTSRRQSCTTSAQAG
jgi:hypothetical protein